MVSEPLVVHGVPGVVQRPGGTASTEVQAGTWGAEIGAARDPVARGGDQLGQPVVAGEFPVACQDGQDTGRALLHGAGVGLPGRGGHGPQSALVRGTHRSDEMVHDPGHRIVHTPGDRLVPAPTPAVLAAVAARSAWGGAVPWQRPARLPEGLARAGRVPPLGGGVLHQPENHLREAARQSKRPRARGEPCGEPLLGGPGGGLLGQQVRYLPGQHEARGGTEAVVVARRADGRVLQALGGTETGGSQPGRQGGLAFQDGEFEVDEAQPSVRTDHDVAGCEIPQDAASRVRRRDQVHQTPDLRPRVDAVAIRSDVAEMLGDPGTQRDARHFLLGQEEVLAVLEQRQRFRSQPRALELLQRPCLGAQPVTDVAAGGVGLHVRPGLLDHHEGTRTDVAAPVDAALVGVPDRLPYREAATEQHRSTRPFGLRHPARRAWGAGNRGGEGADRPRGRRVLAGAPVLHGVAVGVLDEPHQQAVVRESPPADERAVSVVHQRLHRVRLVGQDPRTGQPRRGPVQLAGEPGRLDVGARVDGDELARASPGRGTGVERTHPVQRPGELERRLLPQQHLQRLFEDGRRGGGRRRQMKLPPLLAPCPRPGRDTAPHLVRVGRPTRVRTRGVQRLAEKAFQFDFGNLARHSRPSRR